MAMPAELLATVNNFNMIICGIKLTHDSSIVLIEKSKLVFSYELEKLDNSDRHSQFYIGLAGFHNILNDNGYEIGQIDCIVFDGWYNHEHSRYMSENLPIRLADYGSFVDGKILDYTEFHVQAYPNLCKSYRHVAGHAFSSYCTSPFAQRREDSYILIWDSGMVPQLYYYKYAGNVINEVSNLCPLTSEIYNIFGNAFSSLGIFNADYLSIPGKIMAFAGIGIVNSDLLDYFVQMLTSISMPSPLNLSELLRLNAEFIIKLRLSKLAESYRPQDIICSFQEAVGQMLVSSLMEICNKFPKASRNLCYSGGAALNITWNSKIRNANIFEKVWIPPFPNDSGSAIGAACCEMVKHSEEKSLAWNVYSGPKLVNRPVEGNWEKLPFSIADLAKLMHQFGEPVVFLNESAELGPRALGNRSILSPAVERSMKHYLNLVKDREFYRPIAPVCLEEDAADIFDPGTPDPYMLFTHTIRAEWKNKVPAIMHVDGTARLQTINDTQNPQLYRLLSEYKILSGIPLLCNTSANFKGKGFFPDVASAMKWGRINFVWSDECIYFKKGYGRYLYNLSGVN